QTVPARVSEVGVFKFKVEPAPLSYIGKTIPGGESLPVGRFYPDTFKVVVDPGELKAECSVSTPFVYTGQPFGWQVAPSLTIEPVSVQGTRTLNYTQQGFRNLSAGNVIRAFPGLDSTAVDQVGAAMGLQVADDAGALNVLAPGLLGYTYSMADTFTYIRNAKAQIAPFAPDMEFIVSSIIDTDMVSANAAPYTFAPVAGFDMRFGRFVMENVYGPETVSALSMPFRLEYWNGSGFLINDADSCTVWDTATIINTAHHHSLDSSAPASGLFAAGNAPPLRLVPDGTPGDDRLTWTIDTWLNYDWNGDGIAEAPEGLATFGVYRGHDRVIYWHEVH
ncbi:MAG TPA: DUF6701 domain-containing protein, partial [Marinobacter sp.]|nr:DUF6701 domain-containing protein [Marinobacter sp.]